MRLLLALSVLVVATPAVAQSHLVDEAGPFVSVDLVGGAFPDLTPAGKGLSGGAGYRSASGADVGLLLGRFGGVADTLLPFPGETHLGAAVAVAFGPEASPWRVGGVGKAVVADGRVFAFPPEGPTELREGPGVTETFARAFLARYVRLADGPVRVLLGGGLTASARRIAPSPMIFEAGTPDERVVPDEAVVETGYGALLAVPVAVRLGRGVTLTVEPEARVDLESLAYRVADGQVTARLTF